jgi:hypothetical protein
MTVWVNNLPIFFPLQSDETYKFQTRLSIPFRIGFNSASNLRVYSISQIKV